jgi:hypothetical protein
MGDRRIGRRTYATPKDLAAAFDEIHAQGSPS